MQGNHSDKPAGAGTGRVSVTAAVTLALASGLAPGAAAASGWAERTTVRGFLSAQYAVTDKNPLFQGGRHEQGVNHEGSLRGTRAGLNVTSRVSDRLTVASQLFNSIEEDNYVAHLDWAFARWQATDAVAVRAGKLKFPVGLVNEYVRVGVSYPWVEPPLVIYSRSSDGPQATREGYTGADLLWSGEAGDWSLEADLFLGQVDLSTMVVRRLRGLTARANWNDQLLLQASAYKGVMRPDDPTSGMAAMMEGKSHSAALVGAKVDWAGVLAYAEWADVSMDVTMMGRRTMDSRSWYATLGYWVTERLLPHATYQYWRQGDGDGHNIASVGLTYGLSANARVKLELSRIHTSGKGLFYDATAPDTRVAPGADVNMAAVSFDVVF